MNSFYRLLLTTILLVAASWKISAQVQFSISPLSINAAAGQQVSFDLKTANFTNIVNFQYSLKYNATELEFIGFGPSTAAPTFGLQELGVASFNTMTSGSLSVSWYLASTKPVTLTGPTTLATLLFKAKVSKSVAIGFSDSPTDVEIIDGTGTALTPTFTPALNTTGSGGGGNPCSPDTTPPTFSGCPQNISLSTATTTAAATWTVPTATDACGSANVNLTSSLANGANFPIGTSTVTYTATDIAGNKATCSFTVTVALENTGGGTPCVNNWTYPALVNNETTLVLSEEVVEKAGDQACVRVMVSNFTLIQGLSFSLNWDPAKLEYVGIKDNKFNLPSASVSSLNLDQKTSGRLGFNWDDQTTAGVTLAAQTVIFEICFKKLGADAAPVTFVSQPTDINAVKDVNSISVDFTPSTRSGKVSLCTGGGGGTTVTCTQPTYDKNINIQQKVISANGEVCVDIIVNDFKNIDGIGMSITWDGTKLQYVRLESVGITLDVQHFNRIDNKIIIAWDTPNAVTVEDGKAIFRLCFQAVGGVGSITPVSILPNPEIISGTPKNNVTSADGSVTIKPAPLVSAVNTSICGGTGKATANINPSVGNYSYSWTSPSGTKMSGKEISISLPGIYKVTAVDNVSCLFGTAETNAIAITAPTLAGLQQDATGLTLTTNVAATDVKWVEESNPTAVVATGLPFPNPQANKTYIAIVGSGNTCVKEKAIIVLGVTNTESSAIKCGGEKTGKITLNIVGPVNLNYKWDYNNQTTQNLSNLDAGTYTVTITSADGKVNTIRSYTITAPEKLELKSPVTSKNAPNGNINVDAKGGTGNKTYIWTAVADCVCYPTALPTPPPVPNPTNLEPGTYTCVVTDVNGCTISVTQKIDVQPIVIKLQNNSVTHTSCGLNNGAATIIVEGGSGTYNFKWDGPSVVGNSATGTNLAAGDYTISVSDQKYVLVTKYSLSIEKLGTSPLISLAQVIDANETCKGAIDIAITGGVAPYTYKWSGPTSIPSTEQDPANLCEGTYNLTVTDSKGCTAVKDAIVVAGASRPCPTAKVTQTNCPDTNDGGIELTIVGGKPNFTFVWTKNGKPYGGNSQNLTALTAGTYSVTVTDNINKSCSKENIIVAPKTDLKVMVTAVDPVPSNGKNGSINLAVSGGTTYGYAWENNISTTNVASGLKTGNYTITVTDKTTGCTLVKTVTVGDPGAVELAIRSVFNGVNVRCFGMCNGIVEVKGVIDATPPLKYKWSNGDTSRIAKGLCVGTHKVTVTDKNKENFEGSVTLVGPAKIEVNIKADATDKSACLEIKGGTSPYIYRWNDYTTDICVKNQEIGRVFAMVIDANGCETSANGYIGNGNASAVCLDASPVITPNNDSYNDDLEIYCLEKYIDPGKIYNKLQIFNRWGQEILVQDNYQNHSWKGTYSNGKPLPNGPYFYVIEIMANGQTNKGSFVIINEE
jgi:trimeric autotransporter adhesin